MKYGLGHCNLVLRLRGGGKNSQATVMSDIRKKIERQRFLHLSLLQQLKEQKIDLNCSSAKNKTKAEKADIEAKQLIITSLEMQVAKCEEKMAKVCLLTFLLISFFYLLIKF